MLAEEAFTPKDAINSKRIREYFKCPCATRERFIIAEDELGGMHLKCPSCGYVRSQPLFTLRIETRRIASNIYDALLHVRADIRAEEPKLLFSFSSINTATLKLTPERLSRYISGDYVYALTESAIQQVTKATSLDSELFGIPIREYGYIKEWE